MVASVAIGRIGESIRVTKPAGERVRLTRRESWTWSNDRVRPVSSTSDRSPPDSTRRTHSVC
jgi:hypothetical protein